MSNLEIAITADGVNPGKGSDLELTENLEKPMVVLIEL